ncbi:membrane protein [Sphingomonas metalli]|uniref:Membrane protein n=1 Tax=Sphingomonas metalli TaxID=1779358 RepID=A0A916SY57_9SPHN|nr:DoxX family protein [Sphingomonas metalli]GGB19397.1 membrane protein [Sphingomonas metalli]
MTAKSLSRPILAALYAAAGLLHLLLPAPFVAIVPHLVPAPAAMVMLTGLAEIAGAIGIAQPWSPRLRVAAGWGLAAYALCVWPANVQHMLLDLGRPGHGLGLVYHVPRLALQPVLIWWPLWVTGIVDWPFRSDPAAKRSQ